MASGRSARAEPLRRAGANRGRHVQIDPDSWMTHHDPHRHEEPETARGGLPSVLRARALRVLRLGRLAGHGVGVACGAVDLAVGVRLALPRSLPMAGGRRTRNGGDLIPDEADPRDPAPMALAPEQRAGRVPRPPVVRGPPWRRSPARTSGAARSAKRHRRALGVARKHPSLGTTRGRSNRLGPMSRSPSTVGQLAFNQPCVGTNPTRLTPDA